MYDVVVVGARCGGAPLAMLLARAGHRVALVDRASFPSDTMSTHFLWQRGTARLQAWGLLGRLRARGCAPIRQITFDPGPVQMSGIGPAVAGAADTYCPRRTVLDALLVEAAAESGADLIERFVAGEVIWSDGRATGVRGRHRGSAGSSLRGAVVVGADGMHSGIARRVGARAYRQHPSLTAVYYSYWSGIHGLGASFHARPGQLILAWPTNDDLTCIYVAWPRQDFHQVRRDVEGHFHSALELVPGLREAAASGHREAPFTGTGDLPNYYRASAGPGWALVGDAGHHKDPCTGMGMSDAFLAADLLADAIHQALAEHQPMDQALACYQKRRDALTANGYELTLSTARLAPLSLRLEALYRAAADQPEIARHVFGVLGGSIPLTDLHTQARLLPASLAAPRRPARFPSPPFSQPRNWPGSGRLMRTSPPPTGGPCTSPRRRCSLTWTCSARRMLDTDVPDASRGWPPTRGVRMPGHRDPAPAPGEWPKDSVLLNEGAAASAEEIIAFRRERLAHYKCPDSIEFGPPPKTSTGRPGSSGCPSANGQARARRSAACNVPERLGYLTRVKAADALSPLAGNRRLGGSVPLCRGR